MKNNENKIDYQVEKILYHFNRLKFLGGISKALKALEKEGFLNPILTTTTATSNLTNDNNNKATESLKTMPKAEPTKSKADIVLNGKKHTIKSKKSSI